MGEIGDRSWVHRRVATSAPFFPGLPGGLVRCVVGKGKQRPQGVIALSTAPSRLPWQPDGEACGSGS